MRPQQLARNLAVLGAAAAVRGRPASAAGDGDAAAPAPAAVVVRREEDEVVPCRVVRGEVGREEEEARGGREEGG